MTIRKRIPAVLVSLAALVGSAALASPASAATKYVDDSAFHSKFEVAFEGTEYYAKLKVLLNFTQVAVDDSKSADAGDLYVPVSGATASDGEGVVDKFKVEGSGSSVKVTFECALGGSTIEVAADPCVSGKQAPEAFTTIDQVAVGSSGEVYVTNDNTAANGGERVDEFNSAGEYVAQFTETTGGAKFEEPELVAAGSKGELYIGDHRGSTESMLDKYVNGVFQYSIKCGTKNETVGTVIESICGSTASWALTATGGLAVNESGDVYAADGAASHEVVDEFSSTGSYVTQFKTSVRASWGVATEPGTSNLFIGETTKIAWYNSAGTLQEHIAVTTPEALPKSTYALAVNTSGELYVAESGSKTIQMLERTEPKYIDDSAFHSKFEVAFEGTEYYAKLKVLLNFTQVAVDDSKSADAGDLYVPVSGATASDGEGVVDKFKVEGSGSSVKVTFECALGGSTIEVAADPCVSGKQAPEAFTTIDQVAVGSSGEVYVTNDNTAANGGERVDEFNSAGEYVAQFTETTGGAKFEEPELVAAGSKGELYIGDHRGSTESMLDKYVNGVFQYSIKCGTKNETVGTVIESICGSTASWALTATGGLAVNESGDVYAADGAASHEVVDEFSSTGSYVTQFKTSVRASWGVATEPGTSNLFIGETTKIAWYNSAGTLQEHIAVTTPEALPKSTYALAVNTSGELYVAESGSKTIQMYELAVVEPPVASACTISSITSSGAKLEASVNPNGDETEYEFEYGTSTSYGTKTTKLSAGSGASAVAESATVTGLTPATKYDCRVYATSAGGETHGANGEFTTKLAVEGVKTLPASSVAFESATINASLRPEGTPTVEYFIEYGTTTGYGHHTTAKTSSSSEVAVSEALSGLMPLTTYHYRIVAKREIESKTYATDGSDVAFTTGGVPPGVIAESTSGVGAFSATLEATINPGNSATTYWFEYGTSPTSEQAFIPAGTVAGDGSIQAAPETLQNLAPDTTYYYHVVAENQFGRVEGIEGPKGPEEKSFTTLPAYAPEVALLPVAEVAQTTANVSLSVDPHGLATEYEVQLGQEGAYVPVVVQSAGEGETTVQIGLALSALAPGSAYQVRVLAWNAAGEVTSTTQTFTTGASPAVTLTQPVTPVLVSFTPPSIVKPPVTTTTTSKAKSLTKAQKLAKALKACKRDKAKSKRQACEAKAHEQYGLVKKKATKKKH